MSADPRDDCAHYFADPSGGFGWPSCVKCGAPVSITAFIAARPCCSTSGDEKHRAWCTSVAARVQRGQL